MEEPFPFDLKFVRGHSASLMMDSLMEVFDQQAGHGTGTLAVSLRLFFSCWQGYNVARIILGKTFRDFASIINLPYLKC
ncbi:unnamed protein product [Merluccius merluccius]